MMLPVLCSRKWSNLSPVTITQLLPDLISSIVGRPRHQGVMVGMGQKDSYVGYVHSPRAIDIPPY